MHTRVLLFGLIAVVLFLSPAHGATDPTAVATRTAVETALDAMERAVRAGDIDGYLSHVSQGDAVFWQEQRMWAADLKLHIPSVFELRIVEPAEREANKEASKPGDGSGEVKADAKVDEEADYPHEFAADVAVFELEMSWEITVPLADGEDGEPDHLDRSVSYPVEFAREGDRWLFKGEKWVEVRIGADEAIGTDEKDEGAVHPAAPAKVAVSTRENIVLCFAGYEGVARRIAEVLPEVRAHVDEGFEQEVPHTQAVKIYPTMRHLQASIYLSYVDGLSGWNEPKEAIKVLGRPSASRSSLRVLLAHEYGHVATFEFGPNATDIPWWALEGVAEFASEGFRRGGSKRTDDRVKKWADDEKLADFAVITDFRNTPTQFMGHVYAQGHAMVSYVSDRFGRTKRNDWFRAMANGATIDMATTNELGLAGGFSQLDAEWRADLANEPEAGAE